MVLSEISLNFAYKSFFSKFSIRMDFGTQFGFGFSILILKSINKAEIFLKKKLIFKTLLDLYCDSRISNDHWISM